MDLRTRPLVAGAAAMFAAGILNRLIGTLYRVLLVRAAGEDVVGIFQMTLPIYRLAWTLATAGLHVAIARLTADALGSGDLRAANRYGRVGFVLSMITAGIASLLLLATQPIWSERFLTDPRTDITFLVLPVLLFPAALSAALRGVLQGREQLSPIAISGFAEVVSRVPIVLLLVTWLLPYGPGWAAAGIAMGLCFGEVISVGYLGWVVKRGAHLKKLQARQGRTTASTFRRPGTTRLSPRKRHRFIVIDQLPVTMALLAIAAPLLLSGLVNGSLGMINVALIPRKLVEAGVTPADATIQYGRLFGMALPALYMPMVAIHPLVHAAIPAVAKRLAEGRIRSVKHVLLKCFGVTGIVSVVASIGFFTFGEEIGQLLYGVSGLGSLIVPLAFVAPFAYIDHICVGILYGLGRTGIALINSVAGSMLRLYLILTLVGNPQYGIVGALWAIIADYALTAVLHAGTLAILLPRAMKRRR